MARTTFSGPILSGSHAHGPYRTVGYTDLVQFADIDLSNNTNNTALYSGGSGQFVNGNLFAGYVNTNSPVYATTISSGLTRTNPAPPVPATITADTGTAIYRGVVMYLPANAAISDMFIDAWTLPSATGSTAVKVYVSNSFNTGTTPAYGQISATGITAVGRQALDTLTTPQLTNWQATSTDVLLPQPYSLMSQVVFTVAITGTGMTGAGLSGKLCLTLRYTQADANLGTTTAYPYGKTD